MLRRLFPVLVLISGTIFFVYRSLGKPDFEVGGNFLSGRFPTQEGAIALLVIVLWGIIAVIALWVLGSTIRHVESRQRRLKQRWTQAMLMVIAGILVCGFGIMHHITQGPVQCCGSVQEARDLAK